MKMLHVAAKFVKNKNDLVQIYKTFIRSRLEYSCELWHSSLSKNNESDIERVQKSAIKVILKDKYGSYKNALKVLGLETLYDRRERLCLNFAKKCLKIENFKKLFPLRKTSHSMDKRRVEKYLINNISTERYRRSAIPTMKKLLNDEELKLRRVMKSVKSVPREHCFVNSISEKI